MSLSGKFFRGSALNMVDHVARLAVMLFVTPLIVDSLGMELYGVWLLLMTIVSYYDYLDFGTSLAGVRYLGSAIGKDDDLLYRKTVASLKRVYIRTGVTCLLLSLAVAGGYWMWGPSNQWHDQICLLLLVFGVSISVRFFLRTHLVILKSHLRYDRVVFASMTKLALQTILIVTLLLKGHGVMALVIAHLIADLSDQALLVFFSRRTDRRGLDGKDYDPAVAKQLFRQSASLFFGTAGASLRNRVDPPIVAGFCGVVMVPIYNTGVRIIQQFADLANAVLGGTLLSAFSQISGRSGDESVRQRFLLSITWTVPAAVFVMALAYLYGPAFIVRWLGSDFEESGTVLRLLAFPFALQLIFLPTAPLFIAIGKFSVLAWARVIGAIFNLVLSIVLAIYVGLLGVVIATGVEIILLFGLAFPILILRVTGTSLRKLFQTDIPKAVLLILLPMFALNLLTRGFAEPDYLNLACLATMQTLVIAVVFMTFYFDSEQRTQIRQSTRKLTAKIFGRTA